MSTQGEMVRWCNAPRLNGSFELLKRGSADTSEQGFRGPPHINHRHEGRSDKREAGSKDAFTESQTSRQKLHYDIDVA